MKHYDIVDELGALKAQIAELEVKEAALSDKLRAIGPGAFEGRMFRATVGEDGEQIKRDAKAMADKLRLEGFHAFVKAHEEAVPRRGSVRVVAKTGLDLERAA